MRYCERWEKLNKNTGELSPVSCKSWTCPRCRPEMERALYKRICTASPEHFLTISWKNPPAKNAWQLYLRAKRASGLFETWTVFCSGHIHSLIRSSNPPNIKLIQKHFPGTRIKISKFEKEQINYCIGHLGAKENRQRATAKFYRKKPERVPDQTPEHIPEKTQKPIGFNRETPERVPVQTPEHLPDIGEILQSLGSIINQIGRIIEKGNCT